MYVILTNIDPGIFQVLDILLQILLEGGIIDGAPVVGLVVPFKRVREGYNQFFMNGSL